MEILNKTVNSLMKPNFFVIAMSTLGARCCCNRDAGVWHIYRHYGESLSRSRKASSLRFSGLSQQGLKPGSFIVRTPCFRTQELNVETRLCRILLDDGIQPARNKRTYEGFVAFCHERRTKNSRSFWTVSGFEIAPRIFNSYA